MALGSAGSPYGSQPILLSASRRQRRSNRQNTETSKDGIKILKWTTTIVIAVIIIMGFTCTKLYISFAPDLSITGLVKTAAFTVFMLCNSVAMLCSFEIIIDLIRARHLTDVLFVQQANLQAMALVMIFCVCMLVAFTVGVCLLLIPLIWHSFFRV